jgi:hypothetical protein
MVAVLFLVSLFLPPAVIVLSAVALAIGSNPARRTSAAQLRVHHA